MQKVGRYLLLTLLWSGVAAYVYYAALVSREARRATLVQQVEVVLSDSTALGTLVSGSDVQGWMQRAKLQLEGMPCDSVNLTAIEQLILRNGFVADAEAFLSEQGVLRIRLSQRQPVVRLRLDGMDSYATREGYLFTAPRRSALYLPVVTGSYRPPVPARYTGAVRDYINHELWKIDTMIAYLERSKYPHFEAERQNNRDLAGVRRMRTSKWWWRFEREETFEQRVEKLRAEKADLRRKYRYRARRIQAQIEQIAAQQEEWAKAKKKLEKSYEDFAKLLTFVEQVEADDFWRSELVEIVAYTTPSGALELTFVPRSGDFTIRFGRIEQVDYKFEKLRRFYRDGLAVVGWGRFSELDVRFANQVVCR